MFYDARSFSGDLSTWDISSAINLVSGDNNTHVPTSKQNQVLYYFFSMVADAVFIICVFLFDRNDMVGCLGLSLLFHLENLKCKN